MASQTLTPATASAAREPSPRRLVLWFTVLGVLAVILAILVLTWDIGVPFGSEGFTLIAGMRVGNVITIVLVAACQAVATVLFHTATGNRILTPSIMGFEAIYVVAQTGLVFFFGAQTLRETDGVLKVVLQSGIMVAFSVLLYWFLFAGRRGSLHITLLVGLVLGTGLGTVSTFMQRMLDPGEFDLLSARLFGNISNSNPEYLPIGIGVTVLVLVVVWTRARNMDVLALGRDTATNLGLSYRREVMFLIIMVSVLISISTTMVGPFTFFGFIVATLAYQLSGSSRHRVVLPFAMLLGVVTLLGAYFILKNIFAAAGLVTVIIEFVGGLAFVAILLRKGSL